MCKNKKVLGVLILLVTASAGCRQAARTAEQEASRNVVDATADRQAVVEAHEALVSAYEHGNIDDFVAGLDPTAELLIFHPRVRARFDGVERVREEMGAMFASLDGADWSDLHAIVRVKGDVAWITAQTLIESPNLDPPFTGRGTEIYVRRPDGWKLTHGHWSSLPDDWSMPRIDQE
jgi:ketosteroid isomerase-like protein